MNNSNNDQKTILLTSIDNKRWSATFTGRVTRRDLIYLRRVLTVEYAKHERKRRIAKIKTRPTEVTPVPEPVKVEETVETTDPVVKETPKNVYKP